MKKVLIISYYWPPAGGIGVLRCLKFAKYLREFGWEPVVFTPNNADYPYFDEGNYKDIPSNIKIIKTPIWEPFKLFKILTRRKDVPLNNIIHVRDKKSFFDNLGIWVRGNFFVPDARAFWINPSIRFLKHYLIENPVDAILTDGPPHTNTVIGTQVSRALNIPHLADFQDPWTQVDYYELFKIGKNADAKHKRLEQETFNTAKKITIASPSWKKDLEKIGAKNVDVVYYGYDEDDFRDIKVIADDNFTICHAGLLGYDRNPNNLFEVLKNLSENEHGFKDDLKIKLLGQIDINVQESIIKSGLESNLLNLGTVNRKVALQEISNSWILLLPLNKADNVNGRIPGKFFEYIRAKRPIISFGPHSTDVNNIMQEYNLGINIDYSETEMLTHFILEQYKNFKDERFNATQSSKDMSIFSNFNQTKLIGKYLDEITQ